MEEAYKHPWIKDREKWKANIGKNKHGIFG